MTARLTLSMVFLICLLGGCGRKPPKPAASPDGSMVAVPDATGEVTITIKSKTGSSLYQWKTGASPHQWWVVEWKDNRTLEFESGDIGAYTLERLPDDTWRESTRGGVFSPDGKLTVQTSWQSGETRKLHVWFGEVTGHRSYTIRGEFETNFVVLDPFNCARWDGNNRVVVKTLDGEHSWIMQKDETWTQEK